MEFEPFVPGIEVNGQTVHSVLDGFRTFTILGEKYLADEGVGQRGRDGVFTLDPAGWYSQAAWLRAFRRVAADIGDKVLFDIGSAIPRNARFPPGVTDVRSAVEAIDVAYHMNHRRDGEVMFDPLTGRCAEGIGHYVCAGVPGRNEIVCECHNPYPCPFDLGIVTAMVTRFAPAARVAHDPPPAPCRRRGGDRCLYRVSW